VAYDENLADRIRLIIGSADVVEKKMFGGLAFMIGGNMSVWLDSHGGLKVHVQPELTAELLEQPGTTPHERRGQPMKGLIQVSPDVLDEDVPLEFWVSLGADYARSLPTK
jgi:TfoX N-terminal domain